MSPPMLIPSSAFRNSYQESPLSNTTSLLAPI